MDVHDPETRSKNMARIRSRDTRPERVLRSLLWQNGHRGYRLRSSLPGKPDVVFSRIRLVVFVDGCFWHCCPSCIDGRAPKSNTGYWDAKRAGNVARDQRNTKLLRGLGWKVIRVWEHEVLKSPVRVLRKIERALAQSET